MKVNSINNISNYNKNVSFQKTAVPYPEYRNAYLQTCKKDTVLNSLASKISDLFSPKVAKEAVEIKSKIDKIYDPSTVSPREHLLSVLA